METLTKVGDLYYNLDKRLGFYPREQIILPLGIVKGADHHCYSQTINTVKYLLLVSDYSQVNYQGNYSLAVSAFGPSLNTLELVIDEFSKKTGISLKDAPPHLQMLMKNIAQVMTL